MASVSADAQAAGISPALSDVTQDMAVLNFDRRPRGTLQKLAGLTDQELIIHAIREVTLMASVAVEPGGRRDLVTSLLAVLDRGDVVAARNRLEQRYGIRPLPIDND